jgi:hypothetical protein
MRVKRGERNSGSIYDKPTVATWNMGTTQAYSRRQSKTKVTCVDITDTSTTHQNSSVFDICLFNCIKILVHFLCSYQRNMWVLDLAEHRE